MAVGQYGFKVIFKIIFGGCKFKITWILKKEIINVILLKKMNYFYTKLTCYHVQRTSTSTLFKNCAIVHSPFIHGIQIIDSK